MPEKVMPVTAASEKHARWFGPTSTCELVLFIEDQFGEAQRGVYAVQAPTSMEEGVCIKRHGEDVKLPGSIYLFSHDIVWYTKGRGICADGTMQLSAEGDTAGTCLWNRKFQDARPLTFTMASRAPLGQQLALSRVYLNGRLLHISAPRRDGERHLVLDGDTLTRENMPHLADMALRIVPSGVEIDQRVFDLKVDERRSQWARVSEGLRKGLEKSSVFTSTGLSQRFKCVAQQLQSLHHQALERIRGKTETAAPVVDSACPQRDLEPSETSLLYLYERLENRAKDELDDVERELSQRLDRLESELTTHVKAVLDGFIAQLRQLPPAQDVAEAMNEADALARSVLKTTDDARALISDLRAQAIRLKDDPREQARIFESIAGETESPFQPREPNPEPDHGGEVSLKMEYSDPLQAYFIAPWTGVPIYFEDVPVQFDAENLIPIIDVVGLRYQFGKNRFADMRWALGVMYLPDEKPVKTADPDLDVEHPPNFAVQFNYSVAAFKLGIAGALVSRARFKHYQYRRFAVLIGADLVKIITGSNLEVLEGSP